MSEDFDFDGLIIVLVGLVVGALLIFGVLGMIKKSFKPALQGPKLDSSAKIDEQSRKMDQINRDQKQMMRDLKQRIRDGRR